MDVRGEAVWNAWLMLRIDALGGDIKVLYIMSGVNNILKNLGAASKF